MAKSILGCLLVISLFALTGCGKKDEGAGKSCNFVGGGFTTCFDYTGSAMTTEVAQSACSGTTVSGASGTYADSACATAGRVGSCTVSSGQPTEYVIRYLTGYTNDAASASCSGFSGAYTPG